MDEFWTTLLKVTPFLKISERVKMRKFESGLHAPIRRSLKVYPNKSLRRMMESAMVVEELHSKGQPRKQEFSTFRATRKAIYEESKAENSAKTGNFSKRTPPRNDSNKKQKTNGKSLSTFLGPAKLKEYKEQRKCFHCRSKDHMKRECPHIKGKEQKIEDGGAIPSLMLCQMCRVILLWILKRGSFSKPGTNLRARMP